MSNDRVFNAIVISMDIVKFTQNAQSEIINIFTKLHKIITTLKRTIREKYGFEPGLLSTGDGAIFIIDKNHTLSDKNNIKHILNTVLAEIKKIISMGLKIRVGIHLGECVYIDEFKNYCGDGINDCVRFMTAAEENQIIISGECYRHGFFKKELKFHEHDFSFSEEYTFYDKNCERHNMHVLGWDKAFNTAEPSIVTSYPIRIEMRDAGRPKKDIDYTLLHSKEISIYALTYESLSNAINSNFDQLKNHNLLEKFSIYLYSPKILKKHHPNLFSKEEQKFPDAIIDEVKDSLCNIIEKMLTIGSIMEMNLYVMNQVPSFTGEYIVTADDTEYIRINNIYWGTLLKNTPKLIISRKRGSKYGLFERYKAIIDIVNSSDTTHKFVLKEADFTRFSENSKDAIECFVDRLTGINSEFECERHIELQTVVETNPENVNKEKFINKVGLKELHEKTGFENVTFKKNIAVISGTGDSKFFSKIPVAENHIFAAFALLLNSKNEIALVEKQKSVWTHDVPGGKFSRGDKDLVTCLAREVFEEIGIALDTGRLIAPQFNYDYHSDKENGKPVVAAYFAYKLDAGEEEFLVKQKTDLHGNIVKFYNQKNLISKKQVNHFSFHIPLSLLQQLPK